MKKNFLLMSVLMAGAESWSNVGGSGNGEKAPKIDIKTYGKANPFVGLVGRSLTGKGVDGTPWYGFTVRENNEKKMMFCTKFLHDKLLEIPVGSKVRIIFLGKPAGKKYYAFDVAVDSNFKPISDWEQAERPAGEVDPNRKAEMEVPKGEQVTNNNSSQAPNNGAEFDDLPF